MSTFAPAPPALGARPAAGRRPATDPRIRERRVAVARAAGRRRLRRVLCVLALAALAVAGVGYLASRPRSDRAATRGAAAGGKAVAAAALGPSGSYGYVLLGAGGKVLGSSPVKPAGLPLVTLGAAPGPAGSVVGPPARALVATVRALPASLAPSVLSVGYDASGDVVLHLRKGPLVVLGPPAPPSPAASRAAELASLETVLAGVPTAGIATIDVSDPADPLLTPTGAGPTVQGH